MDIKKINNMMLKVPNLSDGSIYPNRWINEVDIRSRDAYKLYKSACIILLYLYMCFLIGEFNDIIINTINLLLLVIFPIPIVIFIYDRHIHEYSELSDLNKFTVKSITSHLNNGKYINIKRFFNTEDNEISVHRPSIDYILPMYNDIV